MRSAPAAPGGRRRLHGRWAACFLAVALLAALVACAIALTRGPASGSLVGSPTGTATVGSIDGPTAAGGHRGILGTAGVTENGTAAEMLDTLRVAGRAPKTGYAREEFGQRWLDVDRNGCDTRNDVLGRDLTALEFANEVECTVESGVFPDPYTGETVEFERGQGTSALVPVDHVVSLSDAWQKGAQQLTPGQRSAFANDPLNLQATVQWANNQKSDGDAATWLPPNKDYRCEFVARQIGVKAKYSLWVTPAEHEAMDRVLATCPERPGLVSDTPGDTSG